MKTLSESEILSNREATEIKKGNLYLKLYHGRRDPSENMEDRGDLGFNGPVFQVDSVRWTYGNLRVCIDDNLIDLQFFDDLIMYNGAYYSDVSIFLA